MTPDTVSLREYFETLRKEDKELAAALRVEDKETVANALKAVNAENQRIEAATEKRFVLLNELRSGVATNDRVDSIEKSLSELRSQVILIQGNSAGLKSGGTLLLGILTIAGFVLTWFLKR